MDPFLELSSEISTLTISVASTDLQWAILLKEKSTRNSQHEGLGHVLKNHKDIN